VHKKALFFHVVRTKKYIDDLRFCLVWQKWKHPSRYNSRCCHHTSDWIRFLFVFTCGHSRYISTIALSRSLGR